MNNQVDRKILIIDSDTSNVAILSSYLSEYYDLSFSCNTIDAVNAMAGFPADLVILNTDENKYGAFQFFNKISMDKLWTGPSMLLLVDNKHMDSYYKDSQVCSGLDSGTVDFISSPFDEIELKRKINLALKIRSMNIELKNKDNEINYLKDQLLNWNNKFKSKVDKYIINHQDSEKKVRKMLSELSVLYKTSVDSNANLNLHDITHKTIKELLKISFADAGLFLMANPDDKFYKIYDQLGLGRKKSELIKAPVKNYLQNINEKYIVYNKKKDIPPDRWESSVFNAGSLLILPIKLRNNAIAIFELLSLHENNFTEDSIKFIKTIVDRVVIAIENARLLDEVKNSNIKLEKRVKERTIEVENERDKFISVIESISDGIIVVGYLQDTIYINDPAKKILNLTDMSDDRVEETLREIYLSSYLIKFKKIGETEIFYYTDKSDGSEKILAFSLTESGNVINKENDLILTIRDVTHEKRVEEMKSQFVTNVSHEMRTPMASIKGFASTLMHRDNLSEEQKKRFLKIINDESDRLTRLIENLLSLSRIESGSFELNFSKFSIAEIMENTKKEFLNQLNMKNLEVNISTSPEIPELIADKDKVKQLLLNLIGNAIKFSNENGTISLEAKCNSFNSTFEIIVSDNGIGISKNNIDKIFEKFYRVEDKVHNIPGTGIGLSIVLNIIKMHNGKISVNSELSRGSSFIISIPQGTLNNKNGISM